MGKEELLKKSYCVIEELTDGEISQDLLDKTNVILELGLDSLKYAQLMLALEDYTGLSVQENNINWAEIRTIDQLTELFL